MDLAPVRLAPMMGYTTCHMRKMVRLISQCTLNFTEMVTLNAMIYNPKPHYLARAEGEGDTAFQLGGHSAAFSAQVAPSIEDAGFCEININVGCPSNRVQNGRFGACLMREPETVAAIVAALKKSCNLPVTVKHRIGLDGAEDYESLRQFVQLQIDAGCDGIIVHNRTAFLTGLSPRKNRSIPPIRAEFSHWLKRDFPGLNICANGEIASSKDAAAFLEAEPAVDAVMIGRAAWSNPWLLAELADGIIADKQTRVTVLERYIDYAIDAMANKQHTKSAVLYPLSGFFNGLRGAKQWRRNLSACLQSKAHISSLVAIMQHSEQQFEQVEV